MQQRTLGLATAGTGAVGGASLLSFTPEECVDIISHLIPLILLSIVSVRSFSGRWQTIRSKLENLKTCVSSVAESAHYAENGLLRELLPRVLSTLEQAKELVQQCSDMTFSGKLLMQSNLDMLISSLGLHLRDLDVLQKSGVLNQSNAIILSWPGPASSRDDVGLFVRDIFARLQIGSVDHKRKALLSLIKLLEEDQKNAAAIAAEGDFGFLVHLLDSNHPPVREQAAIAVAALATTEVCRQGLFTEGVLGPLIRLLDSGTLLAKENAASAIELLTVDADNAWAVSAYGGATALLNACHSGSPAIQARCAAALRNVAMVSEMRKSLVEEGVVPEMLALLSRGTGSAQEHAAECLNVLALSDEAVRREIVCEGGVQTMLRLLDEPASVKAQEAVVKAMFSLSCSPTSAAALRSSPAFLRKLAEILKSGQSPATLTLAASAVCNLSLSEDDKRALSDAGCIAPLVKLLESKPSSAQEVAAQALSSLLLVPANRKEFIRDDKTLARLIQLLDPSNDSVPKKYALSALLVLSSSRSCRKKIATAGACPYLQKLADMDVAGAKKILRRISGSRFRDIFNWRE
ncbi:unnamed protein product [Victoria cruziana]